MLITNMTSNKILFLGYLTPIFFEVVRNYGPENVQLFVEPSNPNSAHIISAAKKYQIETIWTNDINNEQIALDYFSKASMIVVSAFSQILDSKILSLAQCKVINFHPSLLPHYKGPNPIEGQLINGEKHLGVTWHELIAKIDSGMPVANSIIKLPNRIDYFQALNLAVNEGTRLLRKIMQSPDQNFLEVKIPNNGFYYRKLSISDALITSQMSILQSKQILAAFGWRDWPHYFDSRGKKWFIKKPSNEGNLTIVLADGLLKVKGWPDDAE